MCAIVCSINQCYAYWHTYCLKGLAFFKKNPTKQRNHVRNRGNLLQGQLDHQSPYFLRCAGQTRQSQAEPGAVTKPNAARRHNGLIEQVERRDLSQPTRYTLNTATKRVT